MMPRPRRQMRSGYTLLEMSLALAIALIILGAVYTMLNQQLSLAEVGRDRVEEYALARVVLDRMAADINGCLGGVDPMQVGDSSSSSADSSDPLGSLLAGETYTPLFNNGVDGGTNMVILCTSRVPRELLASDKLLIPSDSLPRVSDLRRISYWFIDDPSSGGLARQELTGVTSTDMDSIPPDVPDPASLIIAPEVRGLMFEYFDGSAWQETWSGNAFAADGQTPLGPPSAIRITLTMKTKNGQGTRDYRRVVALPAGNNWVSQQMGL